MKWSIHPEYITILYACGNNKPSKYMELKLTEQKKDIPIVIGDVFNLLSMIYGTTIQKGSSTVKS